MRGVVDNVGMDGIKRKTRLKESKDTKIDFGWGKPTEAGVASYKNLGESDES
jgi:hypothetical protein